MGSGRVTGNAEVKPAWRRAVGLSRRGCNSSCKAAGANYLNVHHSVVKSMEELLGALLAGIAELIAEFLLEAAFAELAGILSRAFRLFRAKVRRASPVVAAVIFGVVGVCFGFLSVWLFPHHLVHPTRVHGISLLISPILTGLLMAQIGRTVRRWGRQSVRIESFSYGFIFALAMGLVRFWLVH